jgi:hypothetical protein
MSKKSFSSTFGAPKPLPGQLGYGISQTQQLETEAKEMEIRLLALKGILITTTILLSLSLLTILL